MMDELFIKIVDGQPHEHPIVKSNLVWAYPNIDWDHPPANFAKFVRVARPQPPEGQRIASESCTYEWDGDIVKDVWNVVFEDDPDYVENEIPEGQLPPDPTRPD